MDYEERLEHFPGVKDHPRFLDLNMDQREELICFLWRHVKPEDRATVTGPPNSDIDDFVEGCVVPVAALRSLGDAEPQTTLEGLADLLNNFQPTEPQLRVAREHVWWAVKKYEKELWKLAMLCGDAKAFAISLAAAPAYAEPALQRELAERKKGWN